ncbi:MAG: hypothetical protein O9346_13300 [Leptospiraceae bacterium]|jgi:hypothetical protein|nr:hypothetical protein [Leptospiraceae bacterium]MCZ8347388.1 hypothetical protein [Leptospiraceae bacterium]PJE00488.1 MAG: hypothetical protein CK427_13895 [Leptospira sp.]
MNEDIINLNVTIGGISKELLDVQKALEEYRKNQDKIDEKGLDFVEKAELVIDKAERGELNLTEDQKRRIKSNLVKILTKMKARQ